MCSTLVHVGGGFELRLPKNMKSIFKSRSKTLTEIVHLTRELLIFVDDSSSFVSGEAAKGMGEEKILIEVTKNLQELKHVLYGDTESQPVLQACEKLTEEFFKENTMRLLITCLPKLNLEARYDATEVVANLQRQTVHSRLVASDYMELNKDLIDLLIQGYEDQDLALHYGTMLRACLRHQGIARYVFESGFTAKLFDYIKLPNFDIASSAWETFKELMTRHKSTVVEYLSRNYEWFFAEYSKVLESPSYFLRRKALELLGNMLSDSDVMSHYVNSKQNLMAVMKLLRDTSKTIQLEAFYIFRLFIANQRKPTDIMGILLANKSKLLRFLWDFNTDEAAAEQFEEDKAELVKEIAALRLT
ncbi:Mo25-like protein [Thalictrum thalictroides]|uniref:Mo25-like protein n=1 Tax=Thalictrum thalictroides TaxID=46969 RepID=A0A7J6WG59_THATH|nr:Mo25-like protein [Thalictrum thalictroides]